MISAPNGAYRYYGGQTMPHQSTKRPTNNMRTHGELTLPIINIKKERIRLVEGNRKTSSREFQLSLHAEISEEVMAFS